MALDTLRKMQAGGMYDHVAGGFHRYATDDKWLTPHFEKMLYDNALLALAYLDGLQVSGEADMERVVRETLDYVIAEMTSPEGGFHSATDADSIGPSGQREEGYYFTWTPDELAAALPEERARVIMAYYAVTPRGNFEHGRTILSTPRSRADVAASLSLEPAALDAHIEAARAALAKARDRRPRPIRDDKIQTSWNGLMIAAMARAGRVLDEPRYRRAASRAAAMLEEKLTVGGRLHHSYMAGRAATVAFAEDHAFLAVGLIELFQATQEPRWLERAVALMDQLELHHQNSSSGGYFRSASDAEKLLAREMETHDGAIPSAGSWALMGQLALWTLTTDDRWRVRAETTMRGYAGVLSERPWALDEMMLAVDYYTDSPKEIVLVAPAGSDESALAPMQRAMQARFVPNHVMVVAKREADGVARGLAALVPWAVDKPTKGADVTAYVCERGACDLPTTDPAVFAKQIAKVVPYSSSQPE
jgi:hypothetical protein